MSNEIEQLQTAPIELRERRILLDDGRYMIFFEFVGADGRNTNSRPEELPTARSEANEDV